MHAMSSVPDLSPESVHKHLSRARNAQSVPKLPPMPKLAPMGRRDPSPGHHRLLKRISQENLSWKNDNCRRDPAEKPIAAQEPQTVAPPPVSAPEPVPHEAGQEARRSPFPLDLGRSHAILFVCGVAVGQLPWFLALVLVCAGACYFVAAKEPAKVAAAPSAPPHRVEPHRDTKPATDPKMDAVIRQRRILEKTRHHSKDEEYAFRPYG